MPTRSLPDRLDHFARDARAGNTDAALALAREDPREALLPFLAAWVPKGEMTVLAFDTLADAWERAAMEREAQVDVT